MPSDISDFLDSVSIREAVMKARKQVATKLNVSEDDVFFRAVEPTDFDSFNGAPLATGTGLFVYVVGANTWRMNNVGNRFYLLVLTGFGMKDLTGAVSNVAVELNNKNLINVPAIWTETAENDLMTWGGGPVIVSAQCSLSVVVTVGAGLAPAGAVPAFPLAIGFPGCG